MRRTTGVATACIAGISMAATPSAAYERGPGGTGAKEVYHSDGTIGLAECTGSGAVRLCHESDPVLPQYPAAADWSRENSHFAGIRHGKIILK